MTQEFPERLRIPGPGNLRGNVSLIRVRHDVADGAIPLVPLVQMQSSDDAAGSASTKLQSLLGASGTVDLTRDEAAAVVFGLAAMVAIVQWGGRLPIVTDKLSTKSTEAQINVNAWPVLCPFGWLPSDNEPGARAILVACEAIRRVTSSAPSSFPSPDTPPAGALGVLVDRSIVVPSSGVRVSADDAAAIARAVNIIGTEVEVSLEGAPGAGGDTVVTATREDAKKAPSDSSKRWIRVGIGAAVTAALTLGGYLATRASGNARELGKAA